MFAKIVGSQDAGDGFGLCQRAVIPGRRPDDQGVVGQDAMSSFQGTGHVNGVRLEEHVVVDSNDFLLGDGQLEVNGDDHVGHDFGALLPVFSFAFGLGAFDISFTNGLVREMSRAEFFHFVIGTIGVAEESGVLDALALFNRDRLRNWRVFIAAINGHVIVVSAVGDSSSDGERTGVTRDGLTFFHLQDCKGTVTGAS